MQYVLVYYKNDHTGEYGGRAYAYKTELPLREGDIVIAPTWKGDAPARVMATDIHEGSISPDILPHVKEIVSYGETTDE